MYSQLSTAGAKVLLFGEICKMLGVKNCFCAAKHVFLPVSGFRKTKGSLVIIPIIAMQKQIKRVCQNSMTHPRLYYYGRDDKKHLLALDFQYPPDEPNIKGDSKVIIRL